MLRNLLATTAVLGAMAVALPACAATSRPLIYIRPQSALPANQTLNIGAKTLAGFGGGNSGSAGGSFPFMNITYSGTHASSLVFQDSLGKVSQDNLLKFDSHNSVVPNGTYGGPAPGVVTKTYPITDQNGATGNLNVVAVPLRFDVTNIDPTASATGSITTTTVTFTTNPGVLVVGQYVNGSGVTAATQITGSISQWNGTNATATVNKSQTVGTRTLWVSDGDNPDTASCTATCGTMVTQLRTVLEKTAAGGGPAVGDSVYLRCGAVINPPVWDRVSGTTGILTPGDLRIARPQDTALENAFLKGNAGGPWTAITAPDNIWIKITTDACPSTKAPTPTIRHAQINGTNEVVQGFSFEGLNFQLDNNGTNGFAVGSANSAELVLGTGSTQQAFVRVANNTFQGNSPNTGQRGQQGIWSTTVVGNGTSNCSFANITYHDNTGGPTLGSGAAATAQISGGVITGWKQDSFGIGYDYKNSGTPGLPPAGGAGTWATISSDCSTTPTATPNMNGLDLAIGILGQAGTGLGSRELYIHDNMFTNLFNGMVLTGNQTGVTYSVATNFWLVGNTCDSIWNICRQITNAAPVYSEWNFTKNFKYAMGSFHNDDELRQYQGMVAGATYPFGVQNYNIAVRGQGLTGWTDMAGNFNSTPPSAGPIILTGCTAEGNIYVGTFANALTFLDCDNSALAAFNTLVWDPAANITKPNENGTATQSNAPIINKYQASTTFNGTSTYNAVAGVNAVWTGGSPTVTCNVASLGLGTSSQSAAAYAAPPSDFTTLQTVAQVQAAFQPKTGGTLTPAQTGCAYYTGTGGYFDYVHRVASPPF